MAGALYHLGGGTPVPRELTRGPGGPGHQHAGPPSALLARAIAGIGGIEGGQIARIGFDILRPVPIAPLRLETRVLRPGRRVEQLEAVLADAASGDELMRARAWRIRAQDVALPGALGEPDAAPPAPDGLPVAPRPAFWTTPVAYFDALEWRFFHGEFDAPGPAGAWTRLRVPLVADEPTTPLEHLLVMGDAASGISATLDWQRWL